MVLKRAKVKKSAELLNKKKKHGYHKIILKYFRLLIIKQRVDT